MIRIEKQAWNLMLEHAREAYPGECCGAMIGSVEGPDKRVTRAVKMENAFDGPQEQRYELRPEDLLKADKEARGQGLDLIGIFHSHPDCDAYFSQTDLKNSCPWYSFVVLSIRKGELDHANSWLPNLDQTAAEKEDLTVE
jgi:proteasome lid subunit RPN8/RPN11